MCETWERYFWDVFIFSILFIHKNHVYENVFSLDTQCNIITFMTEQEKAEIRKYEEKDTYSATQKKKVLKKS